MALTPTQEAQVLQLIAEQAALLSLADSEPTIISKLGATKVNLSSLGSAVAFNDADIMLIRQGTTDLSIAGSVVKAAVAVPDATDTVKGKSSLAVAANYPSVSDTEAATPAYLNSALSGISKPATIRQTIVDGAAAFITIGSGLSCGVLGTTKPLKLTFANGFGDGGQVDYYGKITADNAAFWPGLTANVKNYLFVDRNVTTGALTAIASVLPYIAQDSSASISVANGQHTYVYDVGQMYVGNGSTATAVQRVAVGECLAGASTITSVISYAKQRKYESGRFSIATGTIYNKNHNLGVSPEVCGVFVGTAASEEFSPTYFIYTSDYFGLAVYAMTSLFVAIRTNNLANSPGSGGGLGGGAVNQARIHISTRW